MGRSPCCSKEGLNKGAWTALEDRILTAYIKAHGEGKWRNLPKRAGLKRCGKSCRLRWLNYLRPDIKRGNISHDEEDLIVRLHKLLGNRWSLIAGRLPGRTDNEIKNYWNTTLGKKANSQSNISNSTCKKLQANAQPNTMKNSPSSATPQVIRTIATRCTKLFVSFPPLQPELYSGSRCQNHAAALHPSSSSQTTSPVGDHHHHHLQGSSKTNEDANMQLQLQSYYHHDHDHLDNYLNLDYDHQSLPLEEQPMLMDWTTDNTATAATSVRLDDDSNLDLDSLAFLFDSEEWQ